MSAHRILHDMFNAPYQVLSDTDAEALVHGQKQMQSFAITTGASDETRTLAAPTKAGLILGISLDVDGGGDCAITVASAYDQTGSTVINLTDAGDSIVLYSVKKGTGTYVWRTMASDGTTGDLAMEAGTGISTGTGTICEHSVTKSGDLIKPEIEDDLTGLNSGGAAGDIIGKNSTANCHIGQMLAAVNGTIYAGKMTCLEAPTGGEPDIDLFCATAGTGTEDTAIGSLEEDALLESAADWTAGATKALTAYPPANEYLYLVSSGGATAATYTAGIMLIELWGK